MHLALARPSSGSPPEGPVARTGLPVGDVVTKLGDRLVTEANGLIVGVRSHDPGSILTVGYFRDGPAHTTTATLASAPSH